MSAPPRSERRRSWTTQTAWAVSGVVLAVVVYELLDLRGDQERITQLVGASRRGDLAEVRAALKAGAPPDAATSAGWTALHLAAQGGHSDVVSLLLTAGAPPGATHADGWTPLHRAAEGGHIGIARMLLSRGAAVDARGSGRTALGVALAMNEIALATYLVEQGANLGVADVRSGLTPVLYAVGSDDSNLLSMLLDRGASPDDRLRRGESALHLAVSAENGDMVRLLLAASAEPNPQNSSGDTPLHLAASRGNPELILALIEAGGDLRLRNEAGQRPLDLAGERAALAELLLPPKE